MTSRCRQMKIRRKTTKFRKLSTNARMNPKRTVAGDWKGKKRLGKKTVGLFSKLPTPSAFVYLDQNLSMGAMLGCSRQTRVPTTSQSTATPEYFANLEAASGSTRLTRNGSNSISRRLILWRSDFYWHGYIKALISSLT